MAIMRKLERDIDILLAEEFSVCPAFADWFLSKSKFSSQSGHGGSTPPYQGGDAA